MMLAAGAGAAEKNGSHYHPPCKFYQQTWSKAVWNKFFYFSFLRGDFTHRHLCCLSIILIRPSIRLL